MQDIRFVTKNDGIGFISIKKGEGEMVDDTERLFVFYSQDEFKNILIKNGFEILDSGIEPVSEKTTWLTYFVKVKK